MDTRGKKRRRERQLSTTASPPTRADCPRTRLPLCSCASELESGEGSCDSYTSDARTANAGEEDVVHIAHALTKVCAKSPEAAIEFVRRVSPGTVVRSLNWDVLCDGELTKMSDGRARWTDLELRVFLESCLEEITTYTITSNAPKPQAWDNLTRKMYEKCRKTVSRSQLQYLWRECRKRFNMWMWLEGQATGLGRDPATSAIVADDAWWANKEGMKKGVSTFRNDPLKHIELHHAVFRGRTVVGNHSDVAGAVQDAPQATVQWETIDIAHLTSTYAPPMPASTPPPTAARAKGKRAAADSATSGGSSKKTRSDSTGQALERLAALRVESMESQAKKEAEAKSKGAEACLELRENDRHPIAGPVWFAACRVFHDPHFCACFVRIPTAPARLEFIQLMSQYLPQFPGSSAGSSGAAGGCSGGGMHRSGPG